MTTRRRNRRSTRQFVRMLRDVNARFNSGKNLAALPPLESSEGTHGRSRSPHNAMQAEEAVRLKRLEEENERLRELVADLTLDNRMLRSLYGGYV